MDDFEIIEPTRDQISVKDSRTSNPIGTHREIVHAVAGNMDKIIDIAKDIVDIEKMKVQSSAMLAKMAEDRKMLLAEAEAYVAKKNADTHNVVQRMRVIQDLLRDFYVHNQASASGLSGEDFSRIITELLTRTE
ncbi:hypothetical protein FACS1894167_11160 [Synergistales bacterium]|nr:hypothetical protein FACS1894167_11160 [Synergistales bacterium]